MSRIAKSLAGETTLYQVDFPGESAEIQAGHVTGRNIPIRAVESQSRHRILVQLGEEYMPETRVFQAERGATRAGEKIYRGKTVGLWVVEYPEVSTCFITVHPAISLRYERLDFLAVKEAFAPRIPGCPDNPAFVPAAQGVDRHPHLGRGLRNRKQIHDSSKPNNPCLGKGYVW